MLAGVHATTADRHVLTYVSARIVQINLEWHQLLEKCKGVNRNHTQQESQKHPIRGVKNIKYLKKCKVDYYIGALTTCEKLLLLAIMHYLMDRHSMDFQCINDDQLILRLLLLMRFVTLLNQ